MRINRKTWYGCVLLITATGAAAVLPPYSTFGSDLLGKTNDSVQPYTLSILEASDRAQIAVLGSLGPSHLASSPRFDPRAGITLAQLEAMAQANNPTLVQAYSRLRAAQANWFQVGLYPNPVIGYKGEDMGDQGSVGKQGAFVEQEFITAGKLGLSRSVAAQEIQQSQYAYHAQMQRVLTDVRQSYYSVLVAQRTVQLNEELVRIGLEGLKVAERLHDSKEVGQADVLQAHIEAEAAKIQRQEAGNQLDEASRRLAAVVGAPNIDGMAVLGDLEDHLPELAWESTLERLLTESPELAYALAAVQRARWIVERECAQQVPNFDLQTDVRHDTATDSNLVSVAVGLPLPLFNRNQGNIARAGHELVVAQREVERVELRLRDRLATAFRRYAVARYRAERYSTDLLPSAKKSLDLVMLGYREGEFRYLALLTAQRTYFQANLAYLDALRELRESSVAIEGLLLGDSLAASPEPPGPSAN